MWKCAAGATGIGWRAGIDAGIAAIAVYRRELLGEALADRRAAIEKGAAAGGDLGVDGAGDDVARRQLGERMDLQHEALAGRVDQGRALAAQRFGGKRCRIAAEGERRRMELHELGIGDHRAGAGRHAEAAAFRFRRVGRDRIEVADAADRQNDGARRETARPGLAAVARAGDDAGDPAGVGAAGFRRYSPRGRGSTGCACTAATSAAMIAAPAMSPLHMHDPPLGMRRLARQCQMARQVAVEGHAIAEEIVNAVGRLARHQPGDLLVDDAGTGGDGVGDVLLDRVALPMAAAMPPCAQAEDAPSPIGAAASMVTGRGARRSAQKRPARPPPRMITSSTAKVSGALSSI